MTDGVKKVEYKMLQPGLLPRSGLLLLSLLISVVLVSPARSAYLLGSGDVLHISVYGVRDLDTRTTVGPDGNISLPLIGEIHVSGQSLEKVRAILKKKFSASGSIRRHDITVELAKYRPFYITGNVARPGAYPYRQNMTVRQAIVVAGGDTAGRMAPNIMLDLAELRSQYRSLWLEFTRRKIRSEILQAEVEGRPMSVDLKFDNDMVSKALVDRIIRLEREKFSSKRDNFEKSQAHLDKSIKRSTKEIASIKKHLNLTENVLRKHQRYLKNLVKKSRNGILTQRRLFEERRYNASNETQLMTNRLNLSRALTDRGQLLRKQDKERLDRKIELMEQLETALVEQEKYSLQLASAVEKMLTIHGSQIGSCNSSDSKPGIVIHRKSKDLLLSREARKDSLIQPGDVIEVNSTVNREMADILCSLRKRNTNTALIQ